MASLFYGEQLILQNFSNKPYFTSHLTERYVHRELHMTLITFKNDHGVPSIDV